MRTVVLAVLCGLSLGCGVVQQGEQTVVQRRDGICDCPGQICEERGGKCYCECMREACGACKEEIE